jgi:hypothetical protein
LPVVQSDFNKVGDQSLHPSNIHSEFDFQLDRLRFVDATTEYLPKSTSDLQGLPYIECKAVLEEAENIKQIGLPGAVGADYDTESRQGFHLGFSKAFEILNPKAFYQHINFLWSLA